MTRRIPVEEFLKLSARFPIIDVRSPGEHTSGHIPGAHNIPLFTNEERAAVGTEYRIHGQKKAILKGLEYVGPKMRSLLDESLAILGDRENRILVHCWRGGMRSESVSWLMNLYGLEPFTLEGGYKAYRNHVLKINNTPRSFQILGGPTGSGKTEVLRSLRKKGAQVVDLEELASHRGSVFGGVDQAKPPTQEQFENNLARVLSGLDPNRPIWLEDESRHIGRLVLPDGIYNGIRHSSVFLIRIPLKLRVRNLVEMYGEADREELKELTLRIRKRLGGLDTKEALKAIDEGNLKKATEIFLHYYDRAYEYGVKIREKPPVFELDFERLNPDHIAEELLKVERSFHETESSIPQEAGHE